MVTVQNISDSSESTSVLKRSVDQLLTSSSKRHDCYRIAILTTIHTKKVHFIYMYHDLNPNANDPLECKSINDDVSYEY